MKNGADSRVALISSLKQVIKGLFKNKESISTLR